MTEGPAGFVQAMMDQPGNNLITGLALTVSLAALVYTHATNRRESRVEKSSAYLDLETTSSEIFRYQAEKFIAMKPARSWDGRASSWPPDSEEAAELAEQFYYQCLNLFEVASNFRKKEIVNHGVFASWVAWFYELLEEAYFRKTWTVIRTNYTDDVRNIFDAGLLIFASGLAEPLRCRAFYEAVAQTLRRDRIGWGATLGAGWALCRESIAEVWRWLARKPKEEACEEVMGWLDKCADLSQVHALVDPIIARYSAQESQTA
jgi:hypothetical protein